MTTRNNVVAQQFAEGATEGGAKHFFIEGNVIYSYGHHFPVAIRLECGHIVFNKDGYSMTTSRHKNLVRHACDIDGVYSKVIFMDTAQMQQIISLNLKTADEILTHKI